MISRVDERNETVTTPEQNWNFSMFDSDEKLIVTIYIWNDGHVGFDNFKEYLLTNVDKKAIENIINN